MKEISQLHNWFEANKRLFPWREQKNPYRVLVSEVMLQQTRASVVIPYFDRWMERFPTLEALAKASQEEVIKLWEGLGYYSRARRLHAAAKQIVKEFGGQIPNTKERLSSIVGLGPYTVGAILSFGFQQRAAAVDGNVARVLSRYFLIEENIQKASVKHRLEELAYNSLDLEQPWVTAEAWIELGANICTKKPGCEACPLREGCRGYQTDKASYLPITPVPPATTSLFRSVLLFEAEGSLLVKKEISGRLMADLYEFPYVEVTKQPTHLRLAMKKLPFKIKHSFTRYVAHLSLYHVALTKKEEVFSFLEAYGITLSEPYTWIEKDRLVDLPFSAGHRKIVQYLVN